MVCSIAVGSGVCAAQVPRCLHTLFGVTFTLLTDTSRDEECSLHMHVNRSVDQPRAAGDL